ncbi:MAG: pyridoxal 5'-phosphate synthase glutaminase subunit PdxT [Actinomycetota bacterium]|nr:pyridoxal 5'-phosphate synthase glutaminase subunit PdxT [Actinomycetota bacterium]MDA3011138.1 pyridoxal 5'-phosphate synthase glutaminase subunit PdxT [Actinomycetota bacterium]MDA3023937.1 pyridoxal 5'-phosphate synthase glutaminase subunit PdxT [Actinomycetota bacterium]
MGGHQVSRRVGVLALQGAFASHRDALDACGVDTILVRHPDDLLGLDGLVIPGGESTTISNLLVSSGLLDPIRAAIDSGLPVFGTCAGMILMASKIVDGRDDQIHFDLLPMSVRRNAYGRQIDSFETDLDVAGFDVPFHAVFIRAPMIVEVDDQVEVLATYGERPVLVRLNNRFASSFHPELTDDIRIHRLFVESLSVPEHVTR